MRKIRPTLLAFVAIVALLSQLTAQPTKKDYSESSLVTRMMAFNKTKDGKLTKAEVTDPRLLRLFELADTNKDGIVTREELIALAAKIDAEWGQGGGDKGGKGDKGPKGFKGKGPGGPPQPGQVLPAFLQEQLNLTADQRKQLFDLQKYVDSKFEQIFTADQRKQLSEMRGPGGKGPPPKD
jgi:hypothetical protein